MKKFFIGSLSVFSKRTIPEFISLISLFCFLFTSTGVTASRISDYKISFKPCSLFGTSRDYVAIRQFNIERKSMSLVVDTLTFKTYIIQSGDIKSYPDKNTINTGYIKALNDICERPYPLQNAGLTKFSRKFKGAVLSADLCPSSKNFDYDLIYGLLDIIGDTQKPIPIALAVTGKWIENHTNDINWLKLMEKNGYISITLINHSYSHPYKNRVTNSWNTNFLLSPGVDIQQEIIRSEKMMIENGIVPSIFFRFPGLISNNKLISQLKQFGLIPVGSDAWLGKGQWPKNGSIKLLHANGHEPLGIKRFFKFLSDKQDAFMHGEWRVLDITDCLAETYYSPKKQPIL